MADKDFHHKSILINEVCDHLTIQNKSIKKSLEGITDPDKSINVLDCTLGGAGHSLGLINTIADSYKNHNFRLNFFGFDRDEMAIKISREKLFHYKSVFQNTHPKIDLNLFLFQSRFSLFFEKIKPLDLVKFNVVLADLGVSSPQLDNDDRGFSFLSKNSLDMRMDQNQTLTAFDILTKYSEKELYSIFLNYGEEPKAKLLARKIIEERSKSLNQFKSCEQFANFVSKSLFYKNSRTHPATRTFQALRIAVNNELDEINDFFKKIPLFMTCSSRIGIISFHSLEDRIAKKTYRNWENGLHANTLNNNHSFDVPLPHPNQIPLKWGKELPRGGIVANQIEVEANPRSRSARLRVFEFNE